MKKLNLTIIFFLFSVSLFAQSPQGLNYQAIARNSLGVALVSQNISIRFTISDSMGTNVYYEETHSVTTSVLGLFALNIGSGSVVSGTFSSINWSSITPWLKVEMDPAGGSNYTTMGSSKLLSVPYAMYAASSPGPQIIPVSSGFAGVIDGGSNDFIFAGAPITVTLTSSKTVTGAITAPLGMLSGSQDFIYDLCYQNTSNPDTIINFTGTNYSSGTASSTRVSWTAASSVVLPAGTYNIGFGVKNPGGDELDNNDYVNGWIMVSDQ